ncbi:MAG: ABC transporter ATP-binding protein [Alkaliphilus sp.]
MERKVKETTIISMEDVTMDFKDVKVLKGINFHIDKQNIFGLLGPSGAGKTTIIKILTSQLKATSGKAFINGQNSRALDDETYSKTGMVLDTTGLYDRLSCWNNLSIYADIHNVEKDKIVKVLGEVGLLDTKNKPVSELSKGMKQRLSIARAILHNPNILFLDEPTSGLDPVTMNQIHDTILEIKDTGTTIFLTTHNMEEAYKLCDTVALLNEGVIVEMGEPEKLCRRYNAKNQIEISLKDGSKKVLFNRADSAEEIGNFFYNDQVESIHSSEPNLESVFIQLTGRGLL